MRRTINPQAATGPSAEIDLTPMLDVVFIMLIFFIVTATFLKEVGIDVNQSNAPPKQTNEIENILVEIGAGNDIWIAGRLIDPRAVRANIERLHFERPTLPLAVKASRKSSNKTLVLVMDAARQAGVYDVSLVESPN